MLSPVRAEGGGAPRGHWIKAGAPKTLAHSVGLMRPLTYAADLGDLASATGWPLATAAHVYHRVGGVRLRPAAGAAAVAGRRRPLRAHGVRRLIEDMLAEQAALSARVIAFAGEPADAADPARDISAVTAWTPPMQRPVRAARRTLEEIEASPGGWTFAKLTIANAALRELTAA